MPASLMRQGGGAATLEALEAAKCNARTQQIDLFAAPARPASRRGDFFIEASDAGRRRHSTPICSRQKEAPPALYETQTPFARGGKSNDLLRRAIKLRCRPGFMSELPRNQTPGPGDQISTYRKD